MKLNRLNEFCIALICWKHQPWRPCCFEAVPFTSPQCLFLMDHSVMSQIEDISPQGGSRVFPSHLLAFFGEILFFWKLVSHGGLDFSIFVSSTIWNQCFRSKNCSSAKDGLERSRCSRDWLLLLLEPVEEVKGRLEKQKSLMKMLDVGRATAGVGGEACV